jgi:hypothetical protein
MVSRESSVAWVVNRSEAMRERWKDPAYKIKMSAANRTAKIAPRVCVRCAGVYQPTAKVQKYCGCQKERGSCSWHIAQEQTCQYIKDHPEKLKEYRATWADNLKKDPARYEAHLLRCRRKDLKRHGMTPVEYAALKTLQGGVCAICGASQGRATFRGRAKDLAVDHDHKTGHIRGLLCDGCNIGLGLFNEDSERLLKAARYVAECGTNKNVVPLRRYQRNEENFRAGEDGALVSEPELSQPALLR